MLCNRCGHPKADHRNIKGAKGDCTRCPCNQFVPPGDADSYVVPQKPTPPDIVVLREGDTKASNRKTTACHHCGQPIPL